MIRISKFQFLALIVLISFALLASYAIFSKSEPQVKLANCYYQSIGTTDALLEVKKQSSNNVSGTMVIHNAEKDSSYGTFEGKLSGENLNIDFRFWSEGVESVRSISYQVIGNTLKGEGFEYQGRNNCNEITYKQGLSLIPYTAQLPLYLFSHLRIGFQDQKEILNRLQDKKLLPIYSVVLVYHPNKGKQVNLAYIYYWKAEIWEKVLDPNSPPDWGRAVKQENDKVLSVNGVQDCVYPNKEDCKNVNEVYKLLNLDKTWMQKNN